MADLVVLGGFYILVQALIKISDWYTEDILRLGFSGVVYMLASLLVVWWQAELFSTVITSNVASATGLFLFVVLVGIWYAKKFQPPWQLREDLYLTTQMVEVSKPVWQTVARQPFSLLWHNVLLVGALLVLLDWGWGIWFTLGTFLVAMSAIGIGMRVWQKSLLYTPWFIFTVTLPALFFIVLFFPFGFLWLLLIQLLAYLALHLEVDLYKIDLEE